MNMAHSKPYNDIPSLPPSVDLETNEVLKQLAVSHRYLAELKGISQTIPNRTILINTLALQEAKDSSAIENIITTHDELYKEGLHLKDFENPAAKEVRRYAQALVHGYNLIKDDGILTVNRILEIHEQLEKNTAGLRKLPGTALMNDRTGEIVYTPPDDPNVIIKTLSDLEKYLNDDELHAVDPLIKMALIHYQFESIHPFYDGNGRTGRIINVLYLVIKKLLDMPVLYLSRFIIENKSEYYSLLAEVRTKSNWIGWVLYMLKAVEVTSLNSINLIKAIKDQMAQYKSGIRNKLPKVYSQDLLNLLFRHPYTRIDHAMEELKISRITATKYLDQLAEKGFLIKMKLGRNVYYINQPLFRIFSEQA